MTETDVDTIADRWIRYFTRLANQREPVADDDDSWDLPREQPTLCLQVILRILERVPAYEPSPFFAVLAAGPLEDLLGAHGTMLIQRVEAEAKTNQAFRMILGGVWRNAMTDEVWARVKAARGEAW